jgi:hypothetical protein
MCNRGVLADLPEALARVVDETELVPLPPGSEALRQSLSQRLDAVIVPYSGAPPADGTRALCAQLTAKQLSSDELAVVEAAEQCLEVILVAYERPG